MKDEAFRTSFLRLMKENNLNRPRKVLTDSNKSPTITESRKNTK